MEKTTKAIKGTVTVYKNNEDDFYAHEDDYYIHDEIGGLRVIETEPLDDYRDYSIHEREVDEAIISELKEVLTAQNVFCEKEYFEDELWTSYIIKGHNSPFLTYGIDSTIDPYYPIAHLGLESKTKLKVNFDDLTFEWPGKTEPSERKLFYFTGKPRAGKSRTAQEFSKHETLDLDEFIRFQSFDFVGDRLEDLDSKDNLTVVGSGVNRNETITIDGKIYSFDEYWMNYFEKLGFNVLEVKFAKEIKNPDQYDHEVVFVNESNVKLEDLFYTKPIKFDVEGNLEKFSIFDGFGLYLTDDAKVIESIDDSQNYVLATVIQGKN